MPAFESILGRSIISKHFLSEGSPLSSTKKDAINFLFSLTTFLNQQRIVIFASFNNRIAFPKGEKSKYFGLSGSSFSFFSFFLCLVTFPNFFLNCSFCSLFFASFSSQSSQCPCLCMYPLGRPKYSKVSIKKSNFVARRHSPWVTFIFPEKYSNSG